MLGEFFVQVEFWCFQVGVEKGGKLICYCWGDVGVIIVSGFYCCVGMVVLFCSMSIVVKLVVGMSFDLLEWVVDV